MYYLIIFLTHILAQDCSLLPGDYTKIVAKNNEVQVKSISSFFKVVKQDDQVKLDDQSGKLQLIPQIKLTKTVEFPLQRIIYSQIAPLTTFISFSVQMNDHYDWLNKFQLLGKRANNEYVLMSTVHNRPGTQTRIPEFDTFHILESSASISYHSSTILDSNHIIIDCSQINEGVESNYFYLIDEFTSGKYKIPNNYPFQNQQRLQIQSTDKYIYRGTSKGSESIIEIFTYDVAVQSVTLFKTMDETLIKRFVKSVDYQFDLIDFKVGKEDQIAILDKKGNIFIFKYEKEDDYSFGWFGYFLGESISFDFNFNTLNYAVIQKNALQAYFNSNTDVYTTTDDLTLYKVHLGQDFLLLTSSEKVIQFQTKLQVVSNMKGDFSLTLSDYNQNDFVTIGMNGFKHYSLQEEFTIVYQNPTLTTGSAKLTLNGCSVTIDYQNIEKDSVQLIQVSKGQLIDTPLFSGGDNNGVSPLHLVDGPKQTIKFQNENGQKIDSIIYNSDYFNTDETFKQSDIIFVQTVSYKREKDQPFQIVTQNKNLLIIAYDCVQKPTWKCSELQRIQLNIQLTNKNTKISNGYDQLTILILPSPTQFIIHQIGSRDYYEIEATLEIDSFYLCSRNVVLYSSSKKTLTVYYPYGMYVLHTISPEVMGKYGTWNPQKLFDNNLDELFYVLNGDKQIVVFNFNSFYYSVIYVLDNLQISQDYLVMNFKERFALIQMFDDGLVQFNVYNKKNLINIYIEKYLSFYKYKINNLSDFFFDSYIGVVNIKAQDEGDVVLTYLIDETDHNALHSVTKVNETKFMTCTQNQVFFFNQNSLQVLYIQSEPKIVYRVLDGDNNFVQNIKSQIVYSNEMILLIDQKFKLINTYLDLKINKLNLTYNLTSNKQDHNVQDLGTEWYQGEVTQFEITFPQIHNEITLISPIEQVVKNYSKNSQNVVDLNDEYLFILKNDTYLVISKSNNEETAYKLKNLICGDILGNSEGLVLLKCSEGTHPYVVGVQCKGKECILGTTWMKETEKVYKTYIDGEILFLIYIQKVEIYRANILELEKAVLLGFEDFKGLDDFCYAITVQKIYKDHYQIYCINSQSQFIILDYKLGDLLAKTSQSFDLEFINEQFYKSSFYTFISILNVQQEDKTFKADYIISPIKGPHYGIHMEFNCPNDVCQLQSKKVVFVIQGYGNHQLFGYFFPYIKIRDSYFIVPYSDPLSLKIVLAVYNLPKIQTTQSAVPFFDAISYDNYGYGIQCVCYVYDKQVFFNLNQPYLLSNSEIFNTLSLYKLNGSPKLMFNGQLNTSTTGVLKITNDYSSDSVVITINTPQDDTPKGSNLTVLWVILGIVGGGLVIGGGIYLYKKKQTKVETLL